MPSDRFLRPDRERRWPARVDGAGEVSGLEAGTAGVAAELVTGAAAVWLTLELDADVAPALVAACCGARAGARVAA
jgi:hypothetical protein